MNINEIKKEIIENLDHIPNYTYYKLDISSNINMDTNVGILLKGFNDEDICKLRLLSVSSLAAMIQHYNIKPAYVLPDTVSYNDVMLGNVNIEKLKDQTYFITYSVSVNNSENSIKSFSKKLFKIKNPELTVQTYFKIYYHFYETQDFNQVIEYMNSLQSELVINDACSNIDWK